jgi:flagella basal body P-ring formation protein FlgA
MLLASLAVHAGVAAAPLLVQLREHARVDGQRVTLGDVANLQGDEDAVRRAANIAIAPAPRVGHPEKLHRAHIAMSLPNGAQWSGADAVMVARKAQALDVAAMTQKATEEVRRWSGEKELVAVADASVPVDVPTGVVTMHVRPLQGALSPRTVVVIDIRIDGTFYRSVSLPFTLSLQRQVLVARRDLAPGQLAGNDDFALEYRNVAALAGYLPNAALAGLRLKRTVRAGAVLRTGDVVEEGAAVRGDRVRLRASQGGIGVEADGLVVQGGRVGELLGVTLANSTAVLQARLVSPGYAVLQ